MSSRGGVHYGSSTSVKGSGSSINGRRRSSGYSINGSSSIRPNSELGDDNNYSSYLKEELGLDSDYNSDGRSVHIELDDRGRQIASIGSESKASGGASPGSVSSSSSSLSTDNGYSKYLKEELGLDFDDENDSDCLSGRVRIELDARGKQIAAIESLGRVWGPPSHKLDCFSKRFISLEDKSSAITDSGVDKKLVDLINKWHHPGMKLCVGKPEYQRIIESVLKIECTYCETVMEIMWGLQQQMHDFVPREKSRLTKEDHLSMSQGLKKFLSNYGYNDGKPDMVNEKIFLTACSLFHCDADDERNLGLMRHVIPYIRDISSVACEKWDILKLAIAVKVICCPQEELTDFHEVLPDDVLSKLKGDAHKYKGVPFKVVF